MTFRVLSCLLAATLLCHQTLQAQKPTVLPLIPYPQQIAVGSGFFIEKNRQNLEIKGAFPSVVSALKKEWNTTGKTGSRTIVFKQQTGLAKEAYRLSIDKNTITVTASRETGAFYAVATLKQLMAFYDHTAGMRLPTMQIRDQPAFGWRGFMLDVSRHFFTLDYLKKTIDRMAYYKANKLHLHLTDDQGWRIEIKQYPLLTEIGAWRELDKNDSACISKAVDNPDFAIDTRMLRTKDGKQQYGGYYTQEQLKELIAYAAARQVEIIPEIDMPGHFNAAIRAYPFLTGTDKSGWGKNFSIPISPCKEEVFAFTQNVLKEIFALFPSNYIHIGADEVEKTTWKETPACLQLMKDSGIASVEKLQSYFIHRIQRFVEANGKHLITWDDALEGGINSDITVMYWRNWVQKAPGEALANGNPLVMSPNEPFYFDYQPDKNSIYNVYHRKIATDGFASSPLLLGGQANLWTEMVPSEARADYLTYPRYLALTESLWTNNTACYDSFRDRLARQYPAMDQLGIHYRLPDLDGFAQESVFIDSTRLRISAPANSSLTLHYTLNNELPTIQSSQLPDKGLLIRGETTVKIAAFNHNGYRGDIYTIHYRKKEYQPPVQLAKKAEAGLRVSYYKGYFNGTAHIKTDADSAFVTSALTVPVTVNAPSFALDYSGFIELPETGIYSFYLTCDDGGILKIGNEMVVDNDGLHATLEKSGQAALAKGIHPFLLRFIEGGGGFTLKLQYSLNGSQLQDLPSNWLKH